MGSGTTCLKISDPCEYLRHRIAGESSDIAAGAGMAGDEPEQPGPADAHDHGIVVLVP